MDSPNNAIENVADQTLSVGLIAAKLFGVVNPAAATVGIVADCIQQRRSQKFIKRLEKLVHAIDQRVECLEDKGQLEPDVDLLDEIIAQAVSDENEEKTEYYAAFIEYYISYSISPHEVRFLSNAFKLLLVSEIKEFTSFAMGKGFPHCVPQDLIPIFWSRVLFLGLHRAGSGAVKHPTQVSPLGKHFVKISTMVTEENDS